MIIRKRQALITMLLFASVLPFKQLMIGSGPCLFFLVGKIRKHELVSMLMAIAFLAFCMAASAYYKPINLAVSLALLLPFIFVLIFYKPLMRVLLKTNITSVLDVFVNVLIFNGVIGIGQYFLYQYDDAAIGFYGRSGLQTHGLAIVYFMASLYLIAKPYSKSNVMKVGALLVFMISCFYGVGVVSAVIALTLSAIFFSKNRGRSIFFTGLSLALTMALGWLLSPKAMVYNYNVLLIFLESIWSIVSTGYVDMYGMPRKLAIWISFFQVIVESPLSFFFGFGGGTFNSRAAFLLNGDYSSFAFLPVSVSEIHRMYVMPLWSSHILSQAYSDGTMNQPFSSVLALTAEYGIVAFVVVFISYLRLHGRLLIMIEYSNRRSRFLINSLFIFFGLLCVFDNILEYPEIVIPFFAFAFGILSETKLKRKMEC